MNNEEAQRDNEEPHHLDDSPPVGSVEYANDTNEQLDLRVSAMPSQMNDENKSDFKQKDQDL